MVSQVYIYFQTQIVYIRYSFLYTYKFFLIKTKKKYCFSTYKFESYLFLITSFL